MDSNLVAMALHFELNDKKKYIKRSWRMNVYRNVGLSISLLIIIASNIGPSRITNSIIRWISANSGLKANTKEIVCPVTIHGFTCLRLFHVVVFLKPNCFFFFIYAHLSHSNFVFWFVFFFAKYLCSLDNKR